MKYLIAALLLFSSPAWAVDYVKPPGAPELFVPGYNVTVSVFAVQTAVGHGIGVFELRGSSWYLCGKCLVSPEYPTMDGPVSNAGGSDAYVLSKLPEINAVLAQQYPAKQSTGTTLDKVNTSLTAYTLQMVDGVPVLAGK